MGQTGVIFFALLIGFVVYITMRSELTGYLQVIGLAAGGRTNCSGSSGNSGTVTQSQPAAPNLYGQSGGQNMPM
jgi:hypothetical protein